MRYEKPKFVVKKKKLSKNAPSVDPGNYCAVFTGGAVVVGAVIGTWC
jgi:hypothetical protein